MSKDCAVDLDHLQSISKGKLGALITPPLLPQTPASSIEFEIRVGLLRVIQSPRPRWVARPLVGDVPRKLIASRVDAAVLGWRRKTAEKKRLPYQSQVNEILADEMKKAS